MGIAIMNVLAVFLSLLVSVTCLKPCPGDTRGDRRCNHDSTHRVCAKIGVEGTNFWEFTGQDHGVEQSETMEGLMDLCHDVHQRSRHGASASGQQLGGLLEKAVVMQLSLIVMRLMFVT